jgi:hypothetical protein
MDSIKLKFGVTELGEAGVTATFYALSAYIQDGGLDPASNVINLGDWIDLDGGLTVDAYEGSGSFTRTSSLPIVVGINSFRDGGHDGTSDYTYQGTGTDTPPQHVVFQFQNIPVTRRINPATNPDGSNVFYGYFYSEMRKFLTAIQGNANSRNFLTGLTEAGVSDDVLWAPTRAVSAGPNKAPPYPSA